MITALMGKPGAGKSYEAVRLCKEAFEKGRPIVTNLPLKAGEGSWWGLKGELLTLVTPYEGEGENRVYAFSKVSHWDDARRDTVEVDGVATGPLVVVDECQWAFSAMLAKRDAEELAKVEGFLATHRHQLMDVMLLCQNHTQLPVPVKHLVEEWRELTGLKSDGLPGYHYKVYKSWLGPREAVDKGFKRYDKEIFDLYDSHALGAGAGAEGTGMRTAFRRLSLLRHWAVWVLPVALAFGVYALWDTWGLIQKSLFGVRDDEGVDVGGDVAPVPISSEGVPVEEEPERADNPPVWPQQWPGEAVFPRDWRAPGQHGKILPEHYVPPVTLPVVGVVSETVVWADGTTLKFEELAERGVFVVEVGMCEVWMVSRDFRQVWRCRRPGG